MTSVPAAHAASATMTTYTSQYGAPGSPSLVQDRTTGDITFSSSDLYVWRPLSCVIPGESGRKYFSSGIPLIGRSMIDQLGTDWYKDNFVKGTGLRMLHVPSVVVTDPIAYSYDPINYGSIKKRVAIRDSTLTDGDYAAQDLLFSAPTTSYSNRDRIDKIQKFTLDIDDATVPDWLAIYHGSASPGYQFQDIDLIYQGGLPYGLPGYQTMEIVATTITFPHTISLQSGDVIYGYDIDSTGMDPMTADTGTTVKIDAQGSSYTTQWFPNDQSDYVGLYRVHTDGSVTITTTDTASKAYAVILRPQWHGQTDVINQIVIPGSRVSYDGEQGIGCFIINPYGADGPERGIIFDEARAKSPVIQTAKWHTGTFVTSDSFRHFNPGPLRSTQVPEPEPEPAPTSGNVTVPPRYIPDTSLQVGRFNFSGMEVIQFTGFSNETFGGCSVFSMTEITTRQAVRNTSHGLTGLEVYQVPLDYSEPARYTCMIADTEISGTSIAKSPLYVDLLSYVIDDNYFGWGSTGQFLGMGLVGVLAMLSCMVGYNRKHLISAGVLFTVGIGLLGYFGLLDVPQILMSFLVVTLILLIFQRRQ